MRIEVDPKSVSELHRPCLVRDGDRWFVDTDHEAFAPAYEKLNAATALRRGWRPPGLGDVVATLIQLATFGRVKPCGSCGGRRLWLNALPGRVWRWIVSGLSGRRS
ncbi:MAG TPA: hypothetical protein VH518_09420 [Tepidisphaeraceae bacterium]